MNEASLKNRLTEKLRGSAKAPALLPGYVVLRHEDKYTAGIPDLSVTGYGRTSWWEVKLADPDIRTRGIQELTLLRLGAAGVCFCLIYEEIDGVKRTVITSPKEMYRLGHKYEPIESATGWNHAFVAEFIRRVHRP